MNIKDNQIFSFLFPSWSNLGAPSRYHEATGLCGATCHQLRQSERNNRSPHRTPCFSYQGFLHQSKTTCLIAFKSFSILEKRLGGGQVGQGILGFPLGLRKKPERRTISRRCCIVMICVRVRVNSVQRHR